MVRAIIVEDEQHCIDRLTGLLATHYPYSVDVLDVCRTVGEA